MPAFAIMTTTLEAMLEKLKTQVLAEADAHRAELVELSLRIHANPELGLQEVKASQWLAGYLEGAGFSVQKGVCGFPTAFRGSYGEGSPVIAFLAEYDALPELGHACGHNVIAAAAVGAGVALKPAVDQLGGTVLVIGTPSEEVHGCKATMADRGAFDGVDAAMMVHPGNKDVAASPALACAPLEVEFFGRPAHAAAYPERGANALDAIVLAYTNVNALRQHVRESSRIHGIILKGGEAPNIIPAYTQARFLVRAEDMHYLEELKEKVLDCFLAAALATGCRLEYTWGDVTYAPMLPNPVLVELFVANMRALGRGSFTTESQYGLGSTDMGNVSQVAPGIHPYVAIAPPDVLEHTPQFAAAAGSGDGMQGMMDGARALALTGLDLLADPALVDRVREEFLAAKPVPGG